MTCYGFKTSECRRPGCQFCDNFVVDRVPDGCICAPTVAGYLFALQRSAECPHHGHCTTCRWSEYDDDHGSHLMFRKTCRLIEHNTHWSAR